jgi:hypothetical protein
MRHEYGYLRLVITESVRDLLRRQHEPSRRVDNQADWHILVSEFNRSQYFF